jgi:ParB/RepB/Spo0J family partition protein
MPEERFERLKLRSIDPNPWQPRHTHTKEELKELVDSIRALGMAEPIVVRPHPTKTGRFQIAAGGRRKTASEIAGMDEIPALIRDLDDKGMKLFSLIENEVRAPMEDKERERAYYELWDEYFRKEARASTDEFPGIARMSAETGLRPDTIRNNLHAFSARKSVRGSASSSTYDMTIIAPLAKEDPKVAETLLSSGVSGDDLKAAAPTIRAHKTHEARIAAVEEIAGATKDAEELKLLTRKEVSRHAEKPKVIVRHVSTKDQRVLNRFADLFKTVRIYVAPTAIAEMEDPKAKERAIRILEEMAEWIADAAQRARGE